MTRWKPLRKNHYTVIPDLIRNPLPQATSMSGSSYPTSAFTDAIAKYQKWVIASRNSTFNISIITILSHPKRDSIKP
jgi:hypothetical protein